MPTPPSETPTRWTTWLLGLCATLVALFTLACSKDGYAPSAPGYYDESDYYDEGAGAGDYYEDYGEAEAAADYGVVTESISSRGRSKQASLIDTRRELGNRDSAAAPPAEPSPDPSNGPSGGKGGAVGGEVGGDPGVVVEPEPTTPAKHGRQIIYTATMQVRVFDVDHAIAVAEGLPDRLGGWLHQRNDTQLVLRIPAEHLERAMAEIAELGVVDYRLLEALDVTAQYTDLDSRIRVLEQMQTQLEALLAKAKDVEQALEIRRALESVTLELEAARAQMRELSKSIAFSTLILRFVAQGPNTPTPSSNDPFGWVDELGVEATEYR